MKTGLVKKLKMKEITTPCGPGATGRPSSTSPAATLAGWKVSGKGDFADNSIFLPATGYYNAEKIVYVTDRDGSYWTSGYYTEEGSKYVHALEFCSYNPDDNTYGYKTDYDPYNGLAVRPVHK